MTALPALPYPFSPKYLATAEAPGLEQLQFLAYSVAILILAWALLVGRRLGPKALGGRVPVYAFAATILAGLLGELYWYSFLFTNSAYCPSSGCTWLGLWVLSATAMNLVSLPLIVLSVVFLGALSKYGTLEFSGRKQAVSAVLLPGGMGFLFAFLSGVCAIAGFWGAFYNMVSPTPGLPSSLPESAWIVGLLVFPLAFAAFMYLLGRRFDLWRVGVVVFLSTVLGALAGYFAGGFAYAGVAFPAASAIQMAFTVNPGNFFQLSTGWPLLFSPYVWKYSVVLNAFVLLLSLGFGAATLGHFRRRTV